MKYASKTKVGSVLLCIILMALSGCRQEMKDLEQEVATLKARSPTSIEPIPEIRPYIRFDYPGHEVDPFDETILSPVQVAASTIRIDPKRVPEFLESYELGNLKMVGIWQQDEINWALINTPDGNIHRVKSGNYMGRNQGKIIRILEKELWLTEVVSDSYGGFVERDTKIPLIISDKEGGTG